MKEFNKILYDILLKIEVKDDNQNTFKINKKLVASYFEELGEVKSIEYFEFETYFLSFYHFCFELTLDSMVREAINFKK